VDILITRSPIFGGLDAVLLDRELKSVCDKVDAVSVAQNCDPYAVFVHLAEEVTTEERAIIEQVVAEHNYDS